MDRNQAPQSHSLGESRWPVKLSMVCNLPNNVGRPEAKPSTDDISAAVGLGFTFGRRSLCHSDGSWRPATQRRPNLPPREEITTAEWVFLTVMAFLFYFVCYTVIIFSNTALVGVSMKAATGRRKPRWADGIAIAMGRLGQILGFALNFGYHRHPGPGRAECRAGL